MKQFIIDALKARVDGDKGGTFHKAEVYITENYLDPVIDTSLVVINAVVHDKRTINVNGIDYLTSEFEIPSAFIDFAFGSKIAFNNFKLGLKEFVFEVDVPVMGDVSLISPNDLKNKCSFLNDYFKVFGNTTVVREELLFTTLADVKALLLDQRTCHMVCGEGKVIYIGLFGTITQDRISDLGEFVEPVNRKEVLKDVFNKG